VRSGDVEGAAHRDVQARVRGKINPAPWRQVLV
jgi:hypothetical protein